MTTTQWSAGGAVLALLLAGPPKGSAPGAGSGPSGLCCRRRNIERYDVTANVPPSSQKEDGQWQ